MAPPTIDEIRTVVVKTLLAEGKLADGVTEVTDGLAINAGEFTIASLAFVRAFILMEDEFDTEFSDDSLMQNTFATFGDVVSYIANELQER